MCCLEGALAGSGHTRVSLLRRDRLVKKRRDEKHSSSIYLRSDAEREYKLYEIGARDEWQSVLVTSDGAIGGRVVRKVIEPASYMVRYLVVFRPDAEQHLLLPANTVVGAEWGEVHCRLPKGALDKLPPYRFEPITRKYEEQLYTCLGVTPHWVEEHAINPSELE